MDGHPNLRRGGPGRPKGIPNKMTMAVKDMILEAMDAAHEDGGVGYLKKQALDNPVAFLQLVAKVIPTQITGNDGGPIELISKDQRDAAVAAAIRADR